MSSEINRVLGLDLAPTELTFLHIALRGIIVFLATIAMVRLGDKRFLSRKTAFDAVLGFILASMLARAVNGSASFFPTLAGGFFLVLLHRFIAFLAMRWHVLGKWVKGTEEIVIQDGKVVWEGLRKNNMSEHDLMEDLRLQGNQDDPSKVALAKVERSGEVSVILKKQ